MRRLVHVVVLVLTSGLLVGGAGSAAHASTSRLDCDRGDGSFTTISKRVIDPQPSGSVGIYAEIKNTTRRWRSRVRGQVCFYDARGRLIENGLTDSTHLAVPPKGRIGFYISEDAPSSWSSYTLRFRSRTTRLRSVTSGVTVTTGEVALDEYGYLEVPVSVRNDNSFPIEKVNVYVTLFDRRNRIISLDTTTYNYTDPSTLQPGETGTFTAEAFADHGGLHHLRVGVEAFRVR